MRYRGYFTNMDGTLYRVEIYKAGSTDKWQEVKLTYEEPFVARWEAADNPFAPSRISTATINIVHNTYMQDVFPSKATDTIVKLYKDKSNTIVWSGYLKANVYDMGFEVENEEISLEASDGLAQLQYLNYKCVNGSSTWEGASMASAFAVLKNMLLKVGIKELAWHRCKTDTAANYLYLTDFIMSEKNFFSSDNNEPWKCNEVLDEICKYVGVTAIQQGERVYLIDFSEYKNTSSITFRVDDLTSSTGNYYMSTLNVEAYADTPEAYMLNGADISFYPVYNKATVKASLYTPEFILPDIFTDDENQYSYRLGDSSKVIMAKRPTYPFKYVNNKSEAKDDSDDATFNFPIKLLDYKNGNWVSNYYNSAGTYVGLSDSEYNSESAVTLYIGGTVIERAQVKGSRKYYDVEGTPTFERGLFLRCDGNMIEDGEFGFDVWKKDEWRQQVSGTCQYVISGSALDNYKELFYSAGDYRLACPADSADTYMVLNVSAIWERYPQPYINNEWATEAAGYKGTKNSDDVYTFRYPPVLNFILTCGSQYYNGKEWQSTRCGFRVPLEHDSEDKEKSRVTYAANTGNDWNSEKASYNNIIWLNWSTDKGFKISLKGLTDRSGKMWISFLTPNALVGYYTLSNGVYKNVTSTLSSTYKIHGAVWITDFSLTMARDGNPAEDKDITYENIINEENINELDEEEFKINTAVKGSKPSYSFVMNTSGGYFDIYKQWATSYKYLCPEEQWIAKQVEHFSVPRRQISLTLSDSIYPFARIKEGWTGKEYAVMGTEVDYSNCRQTITMKEIN